MTFVIIEVKGLLPDTEYEVIPAQYDKATNTITFTTTSFSNYAIATHKHTPITETTEAITKATLSKDGEIRKLIITKCSECDEELERDVEVTPIYYPKTITLSNTSYNSHSGAMHCSGSTS